jgi:outer membrane lipase/esterase
MKLQALSRLLAAAALASASLAHADTNALTPPFSSLYVFGDSLSDSGNNWLSFGGLTGPNPSSATFIPTFPYSPSHTYSNGNTWVSTFASGLGLPAGAAPSVGGGGNYAYGGAVTTGGSAFPPSLQSQVATYLTASPVAPAGALYVVAGGGNDARAVGTAVAGGADLVSTTLAGAATYASSTLGIVNSLKAAGATNIIVWNVPDLGKTPASGSGVGATAAAGSFIAGTFNSALNTALAGSGVTVFDTYGLIDAVVANPALYGFGNVTQACGFAGNGCSASNALFWDGIHPTAFAQAFIGGRMLAAVPEPGTYLLFIAGLAGVGALARRRQTA